MFYFSMKIINLQFIKLHTNSHSLSVLQAASCFSYGTVGRIILSSTVCWWPIVDGKYHLASRTVIEPGMADTMDFLSTIVTLNIYGTWFSLYALAIHCCLAFDIEKKHHTLNQQMQVHFGVISWYHLLSTKWD